MNGDENVEKKSKSVFPVLSAVLRKQGCTQKELAHALGVTDRTMSYRITGQREFTRREMVQIADLLGHTMDYLFREREEKRT